VFLLAQTALYVAALAGVVACSLYGIMFLGGALNRARTPAHRRQRALWALLCLCGIVASATAGFVGIGAIMYFANS
jgi:uncharacterized membrane protein YfcA